MDLYGAAPNQKKAPNSDDCPLKNIKPPKENAQKVNNFSQNNNASVGPSFIPVYTKKTENMCHNFSRNVKDEKNLPKRADSPEPSKSLHFGYSPPLRQRVLPDSNELTSPGKTWSMHMRRRSVGFEDMTSMASRYGYNLTNDQRVKTRTRNFNVEKVSVNFSRNSESDKSTSTTLKMESENGSISGVNQNAQLSENENNHILRSSKPAQHLKDKSSKRKSSLNRIDFIDFSTCSNNLSHLDKMSPQRNSSSDEEDVKLPQTTPESFSASSKRKHSLGSSNPLLPKAADRKTVEIPQPNATAASKSPANRLPRSLHKSYPKLRQHRRVHSASHTQKMSHSAGELESLTDPSETTGKVCLSAQELDTCDKKAARRYSHIYQPTRSPLSWRENGDSSQIPPIRKSSDSPKRESVAGPSAEKEPGQCDPSNRPLELNGTLDIKHMDSPSENDDIGVAQKMSNLDISVDNNIYVSAEENDPEAAERRRAGGSILRKKSSEEKRELHGILKPSSSEDNPSVLKKPPSILKHRESSEEKETWFQVGDLHSILKKSTSEEESCNSGSEVIRPILKMSTDDESPSSSGGALSPRPRPILKKRTSFSEEHYYYASYPSNAEQQLKPILKKKITTLDATDENGPPRPILKSRRKSEDTKSFSEFVASRPRAYSADMGVRVSNGPLEGMSRGEDPERAIGDDGS